MLPLSTIALLLQVTFLYLKQTNKWKQKQKNNPQKKLLRKTQNFVAAALVTQTGLVLLNLQRNKLVEGYRTWLTEDLSFGHLYDRQSHSCSVLLFSIFCAWPIQASNFLKPRFFFFFISGKPKGES